MNDANRPSSADARSARLGAPARALLARLHARPRPALAVSPDQPARPRRRRPARLRALPPAVSGDGVAGRTALRAPPGAPLARALDHRPHRPLSRALVA